MTLRSSLVVLVLLGACSSSGEVERPRPDAEQSGEAVARIEAIDPAAAAALIAENPDVVVLDIRTPGEFARGHIAGSKNVNYSDQDFAAQLDALDKDATYVML